MYWSYIQPWPIVPAVTTPTVEVSAFDKLNPRQREAACAGGAPLLIVAGAGTGKTNTLAHRVAHLVLQGAAPEKILLLTFTRRAALEMTRRASRIVAEEVRKDVRLPWSGTFHSVANRLIRKFSKRLGLAESFSVLDRGDAADLMDVVRHERGLGKVEMQASRSAFRARTPASPSTRTASTPSGRSPTRSRSCSRGAPSGRPN